jgi:drug/metabolite transporter (DMT)-like permease
MTETTAHPPSIAAAPATSAAFGLTDVLLFLMAVIWGVNFVVVKYATTVFNPVAFTGLRVGTVAAFLWLVRLARGPGSLRRRDAIALLLLGALGNGIYQLFFVHGVARTRAGNAALIVGSVPAFVALIARARGERLRAMAVVGITLSVVGVGLVIAGSGSAVPSVGETKFLGSVLVFIAVLCWSVYTIMLQPYTTRVNVVDLSAMTMLGGAIPLMIASTPALIATDWSRIGVNGWLALTYSSVISMGIAYFFYYRGLRVLGPTRTAVYSNLQPIVALLVAWPLLNETPTIFQGVGAATIVAGVFLTRT